MLGVKALIDAVRCGAWSLGDCGRGCSGLEEGSLGGVGWLLGLV